MIEIEQSGYSTIRVGNKLTRDSTKRFFPSKKRFSDYKSESRILFQGNYGFFWLFLSRPSFRVDKVIVIFVMVILKVATLPVIRLFGFFFGLWLLDFHIFLRFLFSFFRRGFCWWWFNLLYWFTMGRGERKQKSVFRG